MAIGRKTNRAVGCDFGAIVACMACCFVEDHIYFEASDPKVPQTARSRK